MKKVILVLPFILFMMPVYAVDNTTPSVTVTKTIPTRNPEQVKNKIEEKLQNAKVTGAEIKKVEIEKSKEKRTERAQQLLTNLNSRLQAYYERLKKLEERISLRLDKLEQNGTDVTPLKQKLTLAQNLLTAVEQKIKSQGESLQNVITNEDPKNAFMEVKKSIEEIKTELKNIHQIYVDIITQIKGLGEKPTLNQ